MILCCTKWLSRSLIWKGTPFLDIHKTKSRSYWITIFAQSSWHFMYTPHVVTHSVFLLLSITFRSNGSEKFPLLLSKWLRSSEYLGRHFGGTLNKKVILTQRQWYSNRNKKNSLRKRKLHFPQWLLPLYVLIYKQKNL